MLKLRLRPGTLNADHAHLQISNEGLEPVRLLSAHIGFNRGGMLDGDYFEFNRSVEYIGAELAKTADPKAHIEILPGFSHVISVIDLSRFYALPAGEPLRARYRRKGNVSNIATFTSQR